ncbi:MAG: hypothetical protein AAB401_23610, partial [Acidobacteriota bacterium]
MDPINWIFMLVIVVVVLLIAAKTIRIVPQATVLIIERLGRFYRLADSGPKLLAPFLDRPRSVNWTGLRSGTTQIDLREQFTDLAPRP